MNTELEPIDRGFRIILRYLDDDTQKDIDYVRKIDSPDYDAALAILKHDFEKMQVENPSDDRFGFTMFQQITTNFFGKVTRDWEPCAWFGSNENYLIGKPGPNSMEKADREFIEACDRLFAAKSRGTPFVPALPML